MKQHPAIKALLDEIDAFVITAKLNPTQFGRLAVNDGNFIRAIRNGRTPSLQTVDKVRAFMKSYRRKAA